MSRRSYTGNAASTSLVSPIGAGDTTAILTASSNFPTAAFVLTIDQGQGAEEKVLVGTRTGTLLSGLTRGFDGTVAASHSAGASVLHTISATDLDEANAHVNATTGVHGLSGPLVDTTTAQTLVNKTLTAPVIGDHSNAHHTHANSAGGGRLDKTGVAVPVVVPFHVGGTLTTGVKAPKFIAPFAMTLLSAAARLDTGSAAAYRIVVNGTAIASSATSGVGTSVAATDFTDTPLSANDIVQVEVTSASGSDLSITIYAVST